MVHYLLQVAAGSFGSAPLRIRHAGRGGFPHEGDFVGGEGVGFVDEVAEAVFEGGGFGGEGSGGLDGPRLFVAEAPQGGGGEGVRAAAELLHALGGARHRSVLS